jgi:hypothetical protein
MKSFTSSTTEFIFRFVSPFYGEKMIHFKPTLPMIGKIKKKIA